MDALSYLGDIALRAPVLAAMAWIAMAACRLKSPAARHAVWSTVAAGMLAMAVVTAVFPPLPVRVLSAPAATAPLPAIMAATEASPLPESHPFPWVAAIYGAGLLIFAVRLAYGYWLTRRLVRASCPIARFVPEPVFESEHIAVPVTVGWLRPKVLLPAGWDAWDAERLEHVLVHERTHIRRADWAIAAMAGVNRCVFWFHPLAWWLERQLSTLAEQACDDAALAQVASRESYAETLLAMAAAIKTGEGRVAWEATAMAKTAEVRTRVERILDEGRRIWPGMTRARWCALAACAVPLVYLAAVARPAHVRAQVMEAPQTVEAPQTAPSPDQELEKLKAAQAESQREIEALRRQKAEMEVQLNEALGKLAELKSSMEDRSFNEHLREQIEALQAEAQRLSREYTENHPQLRALRAAESQLQLRMEEQALQLEKERLAATMPKLIFRKNPEYTPEARAAGIQGTVEVALTVAADGRVVDAKVVRSLDPGLDQKAIECVKAWRYTPDDNRGKSVVNAVVRFRLP
jgi:TonB family protein